MSRKPKGRYMPEAYDQTAKFFEPRRSLLKDRDVTMAWLFAHQANEAYDVLKTTEEEAGPAKKRSSDDKVAVKAARIAFDGLVEAADIGGDGGHWSLLGAMSGNYSPFARETAVMEEDLAAIGVGTLAAYPLVQGYRAPEHH